VRRHHPDTFDQRRKVARPAEQLPAHKAFGRHDGRGTSAGLIGIDDPLLITRGIEVAAARFQHLARDLDAGHITAAQCKYLPSAARRITSLPRRITPTSANRVLRIDDELYGTLGRLLELGVA